MGEKRSEQETAVVLIPGLQGRWEWMAPAVDALARRCRTVTYSLAGEPGSDWPHDASTTLDTLTRQLEAVLDRARLERAVVCGVSFGGLIALRFAATRPHRTAGLGLVSTPGPGWKANARVLRHIRWPRALAPWFVATSPLRLAPEVLAAFPGIAAAASFSIRQTGRVAAAPLAPTRMAGRVRMLMAVECRTDCARIEAPTLVVTGEPALDRVVAVDDSRQYLSAIRGARYVLFERTGHIGVMTRPDRFAEIIGDFAHACAHADRSRRTA
jgi:pimeloyl-ACP methyl ester carboxylesterase